MLKRRLYIIFLITLLAEEVVCQQTINFRYYSNAEGLPYGTIHQLWQDHRGFIWLLAENGLTRFDGFEFISYRNLQNNPKSLASSSVYNAFNGPGNQVYFQTSTCISRYNYEDETFDNLIRYSGYTDVKWMGSFGKTFYAICESGLYSVNQNSDSVRYFKLPEYIMSYPSLHIYQFDDYLFVFNSHSFARMKLGNGNTIKITIKLKDGSSISPGELVNIYPFRSGKDIFVSAYNHLFILDQKNNELREINPRITETHPVRNSGNSQRYIQPILYKLDEKNKLVALNLDNGQTYSIDFKKIAGTTENFDPYFINSNSTTKTLWVASQSSGILLIDGHSQSHNSVKWYHTGNSNLKSNNFNTLLDVDPNVVWLYSPGFGLIKGERTKILFQSYNPDLRSQKDIPTNSKNVRTLFSNESNTLYAGTLTFGKKIGLSDEQKSEIIITAPIAAIIQDHSNILWFSLWGRKSIIAFDPKTKVRTPVILDTLTSQYSENFARSLWCGPDHSIYYVTSGREIHQLQRVQTTDGVVRYENKSVILNGYKLNSVFVIKEYPGNKILLGSSTGLYLYNLSTRSISRFMENTPGARLFNRTDVRSLSMVGDDTLWVGTNGNGLFRYSIQDGSCVNYTTETGLIDNSVYAILCDRKNKIWMSSNKGIFKLDPATGATQTFSYKDGIAFEEFNTNAATLLSDGKMAFGGTGGFVVFHPDSIQESINVKRPVLLRFSVNNQPFPVKEKYHLEHHQNYITLQFASLEQFRQDEFSYAYQLEGLDPDWIFCGKRRFISYANLPPGDYLLKIKCTNHNGIWNKKILTIPVFIAKPWYQTWYFIGALIVLLIAIIFGLFRMRLNQRTKLLLIRDSIARDLHDEIGANLSTISIYSEIAKDNLLKNKEGVPNLLDKISAYTQMSQESMSDIVWMIDSRNDKFENVILKIRSLASETLGANPQINLHMQIDEEIHHLKIDMKQRKNFYMIYKECLNNISKYASCRNVWITLKADQQTIYLEIKDDGVGFEVDKTKGNGLIYMKKRAADIPGEINIQSIPGEGTSIKLRFRH